MNNEDYILFLKNVKNSFLIANNNRFFNHFLNLKENDLLIQFNKRIHKEKFKYINCKKLFVFHTWHDGHHYWDEKNSNEIEKENGEKFLIFIKQPPKFTPTLPYFIFLEDIDIYPKGKIPSSGFHGIYICFKNNFEIYSYGFTNGTPEREYIGSVHDWQWEQNFYKNEKSVHIR